jgi:hypothetical protein
MDLKQEERNNGGGLRSYSFGKVKGAEERWCVQEGREQREDGENVQLRDRHHFCRMEVVPVPQLVCYMRFDKLKL